MELKTSLQLALSEPRGSEAIDPNVQRSKILKHRAFQTAMFGIKSTLDSATFFWYNGPDPDVPSTPLAITMFGGGFDYNYTLIRDIALYGWFAARWSNNIRGPWVQLLLRNRDYYYPQTKHRQWGLFIKTKNRHPRHRGKKSDLLYLRIPHK